VTAKIPFRVIDSGVADGRRQIAFDQALIELHGQGHVPDTVRFLRFPPTVLIGRHQVLANEARIAHCQAKGVGLVRRITGGGAIYLEENQVGWELVLSRKRMPMGTLADYTRRICEAAAAGLSEAFGINARFRPRNDIEVDGRKLCGTGGFFDGDTLIYQGTVLLDVDPARMMACLNVPEAKLKKHDLDSAEQRVTTLKALLGRSPSVAEVNAAVLKGFERHLGIVGTAAAITADEHELADRLYREEIGTNEFVEGSETPTAADVLSASQTGPGGTLTAYVRLEGAGGARRVREVLLTGDFFVTPPRFLFDLEASLRGVLVDNVAAAVDQFMTANKPDMISLGAADLKAVLTAAIADPGRAS
jgi:lipoate-protein ligase A